MKRLVLLLITLACVMPLHARFSPHDRYLDIFSESTLFVLDYNLYYIEYRYGTDDAQVKGYVDDIHLNYTDAHSNQQYAHEFNLTIHDFYSLSLCINYFAGYLAEALSDGDSTDSDRWTTALMWDALSFGDSQSKHIFGIAGEYTFYETNYPSVEQDMSINSTSVPSLFFPQELQSHSVRAYVYYAYAANRPDSLINVMVTPRLGYCYFNERLTLPFVSGTYSSYSISTQRERIGTQGFFTGVTWYIIFGPFFTILDIEYALGEGQGSVAGTSFDSDHEWLRVQAGVGLQIYNRVRLMYAYVADINRVDAIVAPSRSIKVETGYNGHNFGFTLII